MNAAQRPWSLAGFAVNAIAFGLAMGFALRFSSLATKIGAIIGMGALGIILHVGGMVAASRAEKAR